MNLHNIVGPALDVLNKRVKIKIIKGGKVAYNPLTTIPTTTGGETIEVLARVQPSGIDAITRAERELMGFEVLDFYVSANAVAMDYIEQLANDKIIYNGFIYNIVSRENWWKNGWMMLTAYKLEKKIDEQ
ncbi:MAG: hypothetical protein LBF97_02140 [Elusimicrobiota bacterium]|jgi:hypothetical protein|nr:hypothetical protein [Elusimicrobiota bacterium]